MKTILILLLFFNCLSIEAQNNDDKWDSRSCTYSNFTYGFSWSFPNDVTWEHIAGTEKHTIFKVVQPDTQITAFVNVRKIEDANIRDIWKIYDTIVSQSKDTDRMVENNTGTKILSHTFKKCVFCGQHAYKTYYHSSFIDDRYEEPINTIALSYYYVYKDYSYSVTIKSYKSIYDEAESIIKDLFKGFTIIQIN